MSFACQRDSFLRRLETEVVECKAKKNGGVDIVCADSILFPEGGGQNSDLGVVSGIPVSRVTRRGDAAVIELPAASEGDFSVGCKVVQEVDWSLRWDHMQQHSGQHLLSALLESRLSLNTTSWWMAKGEAAPSFVELDRPEPMSEKEMAQIEKKCNEAIREATPIVVKLLNRGDPEMHEAHTRGLPEDASGPLRVIVMGEIDSNLCCGTHVNNLAQLGCLKLLSSEKAKKGKSLLNFIVGDRFIRHATAAHRREAKLTQLLQGGPSDHVSLVEKSIRGIKVAEKALSTTLKELARMKVHDLNAKAEGLNYYLDHQKEAGQEYLNAFLAQIVDKSLMVCLIAGDDKLGPCQMVVSGPQAEKYGKMICELLSGKGGGKGSRFNGKINCLKRLKEVKHLLIEYKKE